MIWINDIPTYELATGLPFPLAFPDLPAGQFSGRRFLPEVWNDHVHADFDWPHGEDLASSPENIRLLFLRESDLEALAMVVSWGTMWRQNGRIYAAGLPAIEARLAECRTSIAETDSIEESWALLTAARPDGLSWSAVIASKVLHFLCRSLGKDDDPPVPMDNAMSRNWLWPLFGSRVPALERPESWQANSFDAYCRYMTLIRALADQRGWSTTEVEATLFSLYRAGRADAAPPRRAAPGRAIPG